MEAPSRRQVLGSLTALLTGASGCLGSDSGGTPTPTVTERSWANSTDSPAARTVRNPAGGPAVRSSVADHRIEHRSTHWIVTAETERAALDFPSATVGRDAARAFVDETDLGSETLVVHQYDVNACETWDLQRLKWGEYGDRVPLTEIQLRYEDVDREGACQRDGPKHVAATLLRVPKRIDRLGGFGYQV